MASYCNSGWRSLNRPAEYGSSRNSRYRPQQRYGRWNADTDTNWRKAADPGPRNSQTFGRQGKSDFHSHYPCHNFWNPEYLAPFYYPMTRPRFQKSFRQTNSVSDGNSRNFSSQISKQNHVQKEPKTKSKRKQIRDSERLAMYKERRMLSSQLPFSNISNSALCGLLDPSAALKIQLQRVKAKLQGNVKSKQNNIRHAEEIQTLKASLEEKKKEIIDLKSCIVDKDKEFEAAMAKEKDSYNFLKDAAMKRLKDDHQAKKQLQQEISSLKDDLIVAGNKIKDLDNELFNFKKPNSHCNYDSHKHFGGSPNCHHAYHDRDRHFRPQNRRR